MDLWASEGEVGMLVLGWLVFLFLCCCLSVVLIHPSMAEYDFVFKVALFGRSCAGSTPIHPVLRLDD